VYCIEIRDSDEIVVNEAGETGHFLNFDLRDVLDAVGDDVATCQWRCYNVECLGIRADNLHSLSDANATFSGNMLVQVASGIHQTIWGDFEAYRDGDTRPWLVIRAIDSTLYEVHSDQVAVIDNVRQHFRDVKDCPPEAEQDLLPRQQGPHPPGENGPDRGS
jgi:hypothetical protein